MNAAKRPLQVVAAAIIRDDQVLIARRPLGGSFGNLWEFPGGKVEEGETERGALVREIEEELSVLVRIDEKLGHSSLELEDKLIELSLYQAHLTDPERRIQAQEHAELKWVTGDRLDEFDFAGPDIPLLPRVKKALCGTH